MDTAYFADFADGHYKFWLPMPRVIAAEREMGCSIFALFHNLGEYIASSSGVFVLAGPSPATLKQCHALIRNALVGGNEGTVGGEVIAVGDSLGLELVATYTYPARSAMQDLDLTWRILDAAIYGVKPPESAKKKTGAKDTTAS